jgi:serine/threonine-protein kinase RsbW
MVRSRRSFRGRAEAPAAVARTTRVVRLRMASRRSSIAPAVDRILAVLNGAGFSEDQRQDLAVALAEALANAAVHGNKLRPGSFVSIRVEVTRGHGAVVHVRDSGAGFDFTSLPDPSDPAHILVPGGRGVFLMRRLVDQLEYNDRGNEARLIVRARRRRPAARPDYS